MKKIIISILSISLLSSFLVAINTNKAKKVSADSDYYASITSNMKGDTLKEALYQIIKGHTKYSYNGLEVAMKITDRDWTLSPDPDDDNPYMRLLYANYNYSSSTAARWDDSQGSYGKTSGYIWNKEHIWAKSNGFSSEGLPAYSDLHHLRASDWKLNNLRGNNPLTNVTHSDSSRAENYLGNKTYNYRTSSLFEPQDEDKGDVARALFYMATRYYNGDGSGGTHLSLTTGTDSSGGKWGYLDTLLAWHVSDPVDEFEMHRNDLIYNLQHNRNPYIDHPEYARAVFKNEPIVDPDTLISLSYSGSLVKSSYKEGETFSPSGLTITATLKRNDNSTYTKDVTDNVTWSPVNLTSSITSVTGSYTFNDVTKTVTVNGITVESLSSLQLSGTLQKTIYEEGEYFDPTGLVVTAKYSLGSSEVVTSKVTWNNNASLIKGQTTLTGKYGSKTVTINNIQVNEKEVASTKIHFKTYSSESEINKDTIQNDLVEGKDVINVTTATKIFGSSNGLRFASGSNAGTLTLTLKSTTTLTGLTFNVMKYGSDNPTANIKINNIQVGTINPGSSLEELGISFDEVDANTITITSNSKNRFYLNYILLESSSSPTPPTPPTPPEPEEYTTITEAVNIASTLDGNSKEKTSETYTIKGYIVDITGDNKNRGLKLSDNKVGSSSSSDTILVYGVYSDSEIKKYAILNGEIIFSGKIQNYSGTYELSDISFVSYIDEAISYSKDAYEYLNEACIIGTNAITNAMWNHLATTFNSIDSYAKTKLANATSDYEYSSDIANWINRYSIIVSSGKSNFMANVNVSSLLYLSKQIEADNSITLIIIISATSTLLAATTLLLIKKKKKHA